MKGNTEPRTGEDMLAERMRNIKHKVLIMSGKGGVGKTSVAVNVSVHLADTGRRVAILDLDLHGPNVPPMVGAIGSPAVSEKGIEPLPTPFGVRVLSLGVLLPSRDSPVIWRGPLKHSAIRQMLGDTNWGELDYLFVDLPPGTGDEALSAAHLISGATGVVIVITPQEVALMDGRRAIKFAEALNLRVLGIVENMSGEIFGSGGGKKLAEEYGIPFLGSVPMDPEVVRSGDEGVPVVKKDTPAGRALKEVANRLLSLIESGTG